jgi:hypothetical protein
MSAFEGLSRRLRGAFAILKIMYHAGGRFALSFGDLFLACGGPADFREQTLKRRIIDTDDATFD